MAILKRCALCKTKITAVGERELNPFNWGYVIGQRAYCSYGCMRAAQTGVYSPSVTARMQEVREEKTEAPKRKKTTRHDVLQRKLTEMVGMIDSGTDWEEAAMKAGFHVSKSNKATTRYNIRKWLNQCGMEIPQVLVPMPREEKSKKMKAVRIAMQEGAAG